MSTWGVCEVQKDISVDPFTFAGAAIQAMIQFSDEYLRLLGFSDFIEERRTKNPKDRFVQDIEMLRKLGLFIAA